MNSMMTLLQQHRRGMTVDEMSEALEALTAAIREHRAGGSLSIEIKVKPWKGDDTAMGVEIDFKAKPPKAPRAPALMFASHDGRLSVRDPRQPDLPGIRAADTVIDGDASVVNG